MWRPFGYQAGDELLAPGTGDTFLLAGLAEPQSTESRAGEQPLGAQQLCGNVGEREPHPIGAPALGPNRAVWVLYSAVAAQVTSQLACHPGPEGEALLGQGALNKLPPFAVLHLAHTSAPR